MDSSSSYTGWQANRIKRLVKGYFSSAMVKHYTIFVLR